jgi:hypothetical protein
MPARKPSRAASLAEAIARRGYTHVGEEEWQELLTDLAPVADEVLRRLLRDCGLPLSPVVEGIRIATLGETERTAVALAREYEAAIALGDGQRARSCRRLVVLAKDRARLAAKSARDPERRKEKEEIAAWLLVWLETPALFPAWVVLRKRASGHSCEAGATSRPISSSIE